MVPTGRLATPNVHFFFFLRSLVYPHCILQVWTKCASGLRGCSPGEGGIVHKQQSHTRAAGVRVPAGEGT